MRPVDFNCDIFLEQNNIIAIQKLPTYSSSITSTSAALDHVEVILVREISREV
jgi:hypothetical protein